MALTYDIPATMQAVCLTGHGGYEQLQFRTDVPVPMPGSGEVLVRLTAAAVNNTDINLRIGWYSKSVVEGTAASSTAPRTHAEDTGWDGTQARFPRIQGADGCGAVVRVGAGVDTQLLGTRVLIDPMVRIRRNGQQRIEYVGTDRDGCFAQYVVVPVTNAIAIHSSLSDVELASFPCAYLAAENMLARAAVAKADKVLITGASGGVGSAAVQLACRRGAEVTALASRDKLPALQALGARAALPRESGWAVRLGEDSFDCIIDCVGGAQFPDFLRLLKSRGRYAVAGAIAGPIVELDLRSLYLKDLSLFGCTIAEPRTFRDIVNYIERGEICPVIAQRFELRALVDAQQAFTAKRHVGKIVLDI